MVVEPPRTSGRNFPTLTVVFCVSLPPKQIGRCVISTALNEIANFTDQLRQPLLSLCKQTARCRIKGPDGFLKLFHYMVNSFLYSHRLTMHQDRNSTIDVAVHLQAVSVVYSWETFGMLSLQFLSEGIACRWPL